MNDLTTVLLKAKSKYMFINSNQFACFVNEVTMNTDLELDWDRGAGEEWARFIDINKGVICMIHTKIGIAFLHKDFANINLVKLLNTLYIVIIDDYNCDDWKVDISELRKKIPEICWHSDEHVVNSNHFSLNELYFSTI